MPWGCRCLGFKTLLKFRGDWLEVWEVEERGRPRMLTDKRAMVAQFT